MGDKKSRKFKGGCRRRRVRSAPAANAALFKTVLGPFRLKTLKNSKMREGGEPLIPKEGALSVLALNGCRPDSCGVSGGSTPFAIFFEAEQRVLPAHSATVGRLEPLKKSYGRRPPQSEGCRLLPLRRTPARRQACTDGASDAPAFHSFEEVAGSSLQETQRA